MRKNYLKLLSLFSIPIFMFIIIGFIGFNKIEKDSEYYKSIGLKLNGKIESIKKLTYGHDYGVISVKIYQTNLNHYDERNQLKRYFGVIKNDKADLVFNSINSIKLEDSIVIDVLRYKIFRNGKLIDENYIGMPNDFIFEPFNEINRKISL
jgi:hypothetical protein